MPDYRDRDSDNDGLSDAYESQGADADANGDGVVDGFADEDGDGQDDARAAVPVRPDDTDGDGVPDHRDTDADGDGVSDAAEGGRTDADGDGVADAMADADADGIPDSVDVDATGGADADADGIDDAADADFAPGIDTDGDGIVDARDPDADGDGLSDAFDGTEASLAAALPDVDGDGVADLEQTDPALGEASPTYDISRGSGCSIARQVAGTPAAPSDPTLPVLAGIGALWLMRRRRGARPRPAVRRGGSRVPSALAAGAAVVTLGAIVPVDPAGAQSLEAGNGFQRGVYAGIGLGVADKNPDVGAADNVDPDGRTGAGAQLTIGADLMPWLAAELHGSDLGEAELDSGETIGYRQYGASFLVHLGQARHRSSRIGFSGFGRASATG